MSKPSCPSQPENGEAAAFDQRVDERVRHGHIPDLRRVQPCDWFYNNPWRRPFTVDMVFGRYFQFALAHAAPSGTRLLDVGSGPGHLSLEFARNGYQVTGIDLSPGSVKLAEQTAKENPFTENFGSLDYQVADIFQWTPVAPFDTITFFGCLHHIENLDALLERARNLLNPGGRLIAVEPARDFLQPRDGAFIALIRILLAAGGHWYESIPTPQNKTEFLERAETILTEYREGHDPDEAEQSPHDNASHAEQMLKSLRSCAREIAYEPAFSFIPRICGGVRAQNEAENERLVRFLEIFDRHAVESGIMNPGGFFWAGEKE